MNQPQNTVAAVNESRGVQWQQLHRSVQLSIALVNGLAAFYLAATLAWNHRDIPLYLLVLLVSPIAGAMAVVFVHQRMNWRIAVVIGAVVGIVLAFSLGFALSSPVFAMVLASFATLGSAGLCIPYLTQMDVGESCILALRILSAISVFGVVVYVVNDAPNAAARNPFAVAFTFVMSAGILVGQLATARKVQEKATGLSQEGLIYGGAGALTLLGLLGGLGPVVAVLVILVSCAVLGFILMPVLAPLVSMLVHDLHNLHLHYITHQSTPPPSKGTQSMLPLHGTQPNESNWLVWAVIFVILFVIALIFLLRQRNVDPENKREPGTAMSPITIRRDKNIRPFRLESSTDPIRIRYQKRLQRWHESGYTIGQSETPRELLQRVPSADKNFSDEKLTMSYEETRYGQ